MGTFDGHASAVASAALHRPAARSVGVDDSSTYRLGSVAATHPSRVRESRVRSPVWPFYFLLLQGEADSGEDTSPVEELAGEYRNLSVAASRGYSRVVGEDYRRYGTVCHRPFRPPRNHAHSIHPTGRKNLHRRWRKRCDKQGIQMQSGCDSDA